MQEVAGYPGMSLEQVVEEERLRQAKLEELALEFGYKAQDMAASTTPATASTSSATTTSRPVNNRVLKHRNRDPTRYNKKLMEDSEREAAARDERMQTEAEPELLPEERPPAWWSTAWGVTERKIDGYGDQMSRMFTAQSERMTNIEQRLIEEAKQSRVALNGIAQRLDDETREGHDQLSNMGSTFRNTTERLSKLETGVAEVKKGGNVAEQSLARAGWIPAPVILGGWAENTRKDIIEAEAASFVATLTTTFPPEVWRAS